MANAFGDLIRLARLERGWSQRELARRIKKSATYIHYIERGINSTAKSEKMQVGVDAVDTLAKVLDLPLDDVRLAAGYAPSTNTVQFNHFLDGLDELEPTDRKIVTAQIRSLIDVFRNKAELGTIAKGITEARTQRIGVTKEKAK